MNAQIDLNNMGPDQIQDGRKDTRGGLSQNGAHVGTAYHVIDINVLQNGIEIYSRQLSVPKSICGPRDFRH
jgi:hypothetical protein